MRNSGDKSMNMFTRPSERIFNQMCNTVIIFLRILIGKNKISRRKMLTKCIPKIIYTFLE